MKKLEMPPTSFEIIFNSQFGLFLLGNFLSLVGSWMQRIACSWLVWEWTQSVFWVGVVAAADLLPVVFISPFSGVAADRWDRLKLNIIAQFLATANTIVLVILLLFEQLGLAGVVVLITVQGITTAATQPSRLAMVQQMVSRENVGTAVGLNSANVNLSRLIGPALAGVMILHFDIIWVFMANVVFTLVFVFTLSRIRLAQRKAKINSSSFFAEMSKGFKHVLNNQSLWLIILAMLAGGALARATMELLPAIATRSFGGNVTGLAVLTGSAAVGAIASGLTVRRRSSKRLLYEVLIWWAIGAVASTSLTHTVSQIPAMLSSLILGASITRAMITTQIFVQLSTPDDLRGRVLSVHGMVARGSPAIGALMIGYAADRVGLEQAVLLASILLVLLMLTLAIPIHRVARNMTD